jgi:hypothetical protein
MKPKLNIIAPLAALLLFTACASILPGNDPVVVSAERTTQLALTTFDTFLQWEFDNRLTLATMPEIKRGADFIRLNGQNWLITCRTMTRAYKKNRTPENKINVEAAVALLRAGIAEARKYLPAPPAQ